MKALVKLSALAALSLAIATPAFSASYVTRYDFSPSLKEPTLQRGAAAFMNYCSGCHSLQFLRYSRLSDDLGIPADVVEQNLMFTTDKIGNPIITAMPADEAGVWFGQAPPDLSLTARAKGPSWIYSYLMTFYLDDSKATGMNNETLPGASMPHVLGSLQGYQKAVYKTVTDSAGNPKEVIDKFETVIPGSMSDEEYARLAADLTNFLEYVGEPAKLTRKTIGFWVIFYLVILTSLAYALKREYWKDVH